MRKYYHICQWATLINVQEWGDGFRFYDKKMHKITCCPECGGALLNSDVGTLLKRKKK